jgi:GxxExxY protein
MMGELIYEDLTYSIRGALFEVYKEKGCGFLEDVYQECLEIEFGLQEIPFEAQYPLKLSYKGTPLKRRYIPDFIVNGKIIIEIKAVKELSDGHRAQLHNYLTATGHRLGLLVNFGHYPQIQIERIAN